MAFGFSFAPPPAMTGDQAAGALSPDQPMPAAAPIMQSPPAPQAAQQPYKPGVLDILQGVIFDGQSPAEAAMSARQRNYQAQTMQLMATALQNAPPAQRLAMLLNPGKLGEEFAKNFAPVTTAEGATTSMYGGPGSGTSGQRFTAPKFGIDEKSGKPYAVNANGGGPTGDSLGGDVSVSPTGAVVSGRTGLTGQTVALPQLKPVGSALESFTPGISGGPGLPTLPGGPASPSPTPAANANAPRGIRNNNFGNVRPLANGQTWAGQAGVDKDGYAVFANPADGVKASATNLQSYAKQGINTVAGIVSRWAPSGDGKNDPVAYAHYLAGKLGVDPTQPLDMNDKTIQQGLLRGIFDFENGPQQMAGWRGQIPQGQRSAPTGASTVQTLAGANAPKLLDPSDPRMARFPKGTAVEESPAGELSVVQHPEYSPEAKSTIRDHVVSSDAYKQAKASMSAYQAMIANAKTMTGPSAYSMLDTFARAINPGAVARPTVIETIEKNLGLPARLVGSLESAFGQGNLPPQVRQQIIDAVVPFAQSHWDQANMLNSANAALAKQHDFNPADVTGPLEPRPVRYNIAAADAGVPPTSHRKAGQTYTTPKGPMKWTGTGWLPAN